MYLVALCIVLLAVGAMRIDKDLVAASATPLVLAILAEGESYGYAILKRVRALSGGELEWTDGMLYPLLHRLERLGHVKTDWRTPPEGRRRKYYVITKDGRASTRGPATAVGGRQPCAEQRLAGRRAAGGRRGGVEVESWSRRSQSGARTSRTPGVNGRDVDELEDHLRHQIAELNAVGLAADEAFLVAVKRMGDVDALSREFAREHSGRLWKQLVLSGDDERGARVRRLGRGARLRCGCGRRVPGRAARCRLPRRGAELVLPEPRPVRAAVPRGVLRLPTGARRARMGADGGAVRARCARDQPLPVGRGLGHRGPRRGPPARRAVVRGRLPVHGRHAPIARAAHGLRPLHGRVVHLLRADRARGRGAHGADRGHPRARGRRRPSGSSSGCCRQARRVP